MEIQWLWRLSDIYQLALKVKEKIAKSKAKIYSNISLYSSSKTDYAHYNAYGSKIMK